MLFICDPFSEDITDICNDLDITLYSLDFRYFNRYLYTDFLGRTTPTLFEKTYKKNPITKEYYSLIDKFVRENHIKYIHTRTIHLYKDFI